jgi:hypothetical protein
MAQCVTTAGVSGEMIRDLMLEVVERRVDRSTDLLISLQGLILHFRALEDRTSRVKLGAKRKGGGTKGRNFV